MENLDSEWRRKGATLSHQTAEEEFGLAPAGDRLRRCGFEARQFITFDNLFRLFSDISGFPPPNRLCRRANLPFEGRTSSSHACRPGAPPHRAAPGTLLLFDNPRPNSAVTHVAAAPPLAPLCNLFQTKHFHSPASNPRDSSQHASRPAAPQIHPPLRPQNWNL